MEPVLCVTARIHGATVGYKLRAFLVRWRWCQPTSLKQRETMQNVGNIWTGSTPRQSSGSGMLPQKRSTEPRDVCFPSPSWRSTLSIGSRTPSSLTTQTEQFKLRLKTFLSWCWKRGAFAHCDYSYFSSFLTQLLDSLMIKRCHAAGHSFSVAFIVVKATRNRPTQFY